MAETRKLAAILVADVVGYSRLAGADEEGTLARLRALRSDLIDPATAAHHGRTVKRTGDGILIEFRSVVDAVRCAIEVQNGMVERNVGLPPERRIEFRVGVDLGDVVEETDGDLMGDGVNIAARLEGIAKPGGNLFFRTSLLAGQGEARSRRCRSRPERAQEHRRADLGLFARYRRANSAEAHAGLGARTIRPAAPLNRRPAVRQYRRRRGAGSFRGRCHRKSDDRPLADSRLIRIGRNTAFTYKGKPVDLKQIGRELNVRYVLEGSVQRGGNRMRVNVQLIDAEAGSHLWAERFDKPLADLFDMQDEIVARLANALNAQLVAAEARRGERAVNPDSRDLYFQGMAWFNKGLGPDSLSRARSFFERALALDPGNLDAELGTAQVDAQLGNSYLTDDPRGHCAAAEAILTKVLSLAPNNAWAHYWLGFVQISSNRAVQGIAECERALALDPNLARAHARMGLGKIFSGRPDETEPHVKEALRLSPWDDFTFEG